MFKKLTKFLVSQMESREQWVPVESTADHDHFKPLCLLIQKNKPNTTFHPDPYYQEVGFKLDDVLLPGKDGKNTEPLHEDSTQFTITAADAIKGEGGVSISFDPASIGLELDGSSCQGMSVTPHKKSVVLQSLEEVRKERKINMEHSLIQQLLRTGSNLFVVIEILEASENCVYVESTKEEGGFWARIYALIWGKVSRETKQRLVVSKGCTLAFRAMPVNIKSGAWDLIYFLAKPTGIPICAIAHPSQEKLGTVMEEVKHHCQIFSKLPPELLLIVFNTIKAVMKDMNLCKELSQNMEAISKEKGGYELKTKSPDLKDLFSTLQQTPRDRLVLLAKGITYILDALHELLEDQLLLLLKSLERKIVPQQLKLVENLLKQDLEKQKEPFRFDARLLSFSQEEERDLTIALAL
uniref:Uncharacterized protein n=1 Tax=Malurus cyaneus samueli TaxID=2593467 RepID=A0A8C5TJS9_9PASS